MLQSQADTTRISAKFLPENSATLVDAFNVCPNIAARYEGEIATIMHRKVRLKGKLPIVTAAPAQEKKTEKVAKQTKPVSYSDQLRMQSEANIIAAIRDSDGRSIKEISQVTGISVTTVQKRITDMRDRGLVKSSTRKVKVASASGVQIERIWRASKEVL